MAAPSSASGGGEPIGTYLMPLYAGISWIGLLSVKNVHSVMGPVSLFGAGWALRNTLVGSNFDLGVVTMGLVSATIGFDSLFINKDNNKMAQQGSNGRSAIPFVLAFESILVSFNYAIPFLIWDQLEKSLSKSKSSMWFKIFKAYCAVQSAFWIYAAYRFYKKNDNKRLE